MAAPAMTVAFTRSVAMAMVDDEQQRRRKSSSGLGDVKKYREVQNDNLARTEREPASAKIIRVHPHHHLVKRADTWWAIKALARTKRDLTNERGEVGKEWWVFLGMEFGWVRDAGGILRAHPGKREPKDRDLSFEEVAAYYGLNRSTVEQYDRTARRIYREHAEAVRFEGPDDEEE